MLTRPFKIPNVSNGDVISYSVETNKPLNFQIFSNYYQIEKLIHNHTIYPRWRFYVLNPDETVRYEIPAEDIQLGGSYSENYQNGQRRTLSLTFNNESGKYTPSINNFWVGTKISFMMGMALPQDNDTVIWFSKGIYSLTSASPSKNAESKIVSMEFADKFNILEGATGVIPTSYEVPVGTEIELIINDILAYNKGDGSCIDSRPIIYHSSFKGKTTQQTISESAGSTWGNVILKLAEMLSAEVFYNSDGNLTFVPKIEVTQDGDKPVVYNFFENEGDFQNNDLSFDMSSIVNRVVVIGANINGGTCQAIAVNDDSSSPICYQRIGYRTASPINDSNITSEILAQERADYELRKQIILKTSINNTVLINPLLSVNSVVTITDDFFDFIQERILLQSISFSIDYSGIMSISSTNIKNLPFVSN